MRIVSITFIGILLILCSCKNKIEKDTSNEITNVKEISFYTPDSIRIFGDLYDTSTPEVYKWMHDNIDLWKEKPTL